MTRSEGVIETGVSIHTKLVTSGYSGTKELYITASPSPADPASTQIRSILEAARDVLLSHNAQIFQERIFATSEVSADPVLR